MKSNKNRVLCWDTSAIENENNLQICTHKPQKREIALLCNDEWEGVHNGYGSLMKVGDGYRLYYRAFAARHLMNKTLSFGPAVICVAESHDGITFQKPILKKFDYNGTKYNNIVFMREKPIDNFSVFYDTNPNCPSDERFKALCETHVEGGVRLRYYASEDGFDFTERYDLDVAGTFDSYNVTFWDEETQQYFLYYRAFHKAEGADLLGWKGVDVVSDIRDVRLATSKDFRTWEAHGRIQFEEGQADYPLYTNQISKYDRAKDMFIGFPVRYCERSADKRNFSFMPLGDRHENITALYGREGTALTDCVMMTSRNGLTFDRRDEAFLTPGPEAQNNWWYGNCYTVYGFAETPSDEAGAANELSMYVGENYRIKSVNFRRYTLRLDGFYSWFGPYRGAEVLTKPVTVAGDGLEVNFASSAIGGMEITLCDTDGNELEGYKSYTMFGDSVNRPVEFEKPLTELHGKSVRLKIKLCDCHLYSFTFV